ncbi:hypothetical protein AB0B66_10670 [Catellatospora sp. NPDC049111]|uniref:hypothetical protein n=1 Tax=Catellatospora sp. NPDC049111 TaxID=3155271 RepID=UPI0033D11AFE
MKLSEMGKVLAKCAAFDARTIGESDVMAWFEAVGHLDYHFAMEAVSRYYAASRQRMWPVDLVEAVRMVRAEHERQLRMSGRAPQRIEPSDIRDARLRAGVRRVMQAASLPRQIEASDVHQRALERARAERGQGGRPDRRRTRTGRPLDLEAVTVPPAWAKEEIRELLSDAALHERGRPCGREGCDNPRCISGGV